MFIERKERCFFDSIKEGEVFAITINNNDCHFLKTEEEQCNDDYGEIFTINAINLENGMFTHFEVSDKVRLVNCKLIIE